MIEMKNFWGLSLAAALILLVLPLSLSAQPVVLPDDPGIRTGALGNGLTYYIIPDQSDKGVADFALVQKMGFACEEPGQKGFTELNALLSFLRTESFPHGKAVSFLARIGSPIWSGATFRCTPDATIYSFSDIPAGESAVCDSVLLLMSNIASGPMYSERFADSVSAVLPQYHNMLMDRSDVFQVALSRHLFERFRFDGGDSLDVDQMRGYFRKWAPMSQQAVIVSGDVDPDYIQRSISLLFMREPYRKFDGSNPYVEVTESDTMKCVYLPTELLPYSEISVSYLLKSLPIHLRNSVMSVITSQMNLYVRKLFEERLHVASSAYGIPAVACKVTVDRSSLTRDADIFRIFIRVPSAFRDSTLNMLAKELSSLSGYGFEEHEYVTARHSFMNGIWNSDDGRYNASDVERAVSDFMENGSLASPESEREYILSRQLPDSLGYAFLNKYVKTLFDRDRNLLLVVSGPEGEEPECGHFRKLFMDGWNNKVYDSLYRHDPHMDTCMLPPVPKKVSARISRKEHLTKSPVFAFSNGLNVYYRQNTESEHVRFSVSYRGGYGQNRSYVKGQGAFYSDIMKLDSISGMPYERFENMLNAYGITMDYRFGLNDLEIYGKCPADALGILWRSLNAVVNYRTPDHEAFRRYFDGQKILLGYVSDNYDQIRSDMLSSLLHPEQKYTQVKRKGALRGLDYDRIRSFISRKLSSSGDMVFAFSSPLSEDAFKSVSAVSVGWFDKTHSPRPHPVPGESACSGTITSRFTIPMEDPYKSVDVVYTMPLPYTAGNLFLTEMAARALEFKVNEKLSPYCISSKVKPYLDSTPDDRCYIRVEVKMPSSIRSLEMVHVVKQAVASLGESDAVYIERARKALLDRIVSESSTDDYWFKVINSRYVMNKDIVSHYDKKIAEISVADVVRFVKMISGSGCVELIARGIQPDAEAEK